MIASIGQSVWSCKLSVHCLGFQLVISSLSRSDFILSGPHVFLLFPLITGCVLHYSIEIICLKVLLNTCHNDLHRVLA